MSSTHKRPGRQQIERCITLANIQEENSFDPTRGESADDASVSQPAKVAVKASDDDIDRSSVVKVHTVKSEIQPDLPWRKFRPKQNTGSGFLITYDGKPYILTNAHVVTDATYVEVSKSGETRQYVATRQKVSHECDLAILTVEEDDFWTGTPFTFGSLPKLKDDVRVIGYPKGGEGVSITTGVVSRIEVQTYAHSNAFLLAIQVDAAINSGNSGGPVLDSQGQVVGVAFQGIDSSQNIGYVIPVPIIQHFLDDTDPSSNGTKCNGFCRLGIHWQNLMNKQLRNYFGVPGNEDAGALISGTSEISPAKDFLKRGDIIVSLDGNEIANDGTVAAGDRLRLHYSHIIHQKFKGETVHLKILREGELHEFDVPVQPLPPLIPERIYDEPQPFFIYGGFAFIPLTKPFLRQWGSDWQMDAPTVLVNIAETGQRKTLEEQPVVMAYSFASSGAGYTSSAYENLLVVSVNGQPVINLSQMYKLVQEMHATSDHLVFELFAPGGNSLVALSTAEYEKVLADTMELYSIPVSVSPDLLAEHGPLRPDSA